MSLIDRSVPIPGSTESKYAIEQQDRRRVPSLATGSPCRSSVISILLSIEQRVGPPRRLRRRWWPWE